MRDEYFISFLLSPYLSLGARLEFKYIGVQGLLNILKMMMDREHPRHVFQI